MGGKCQLVKVGMLCFGFFFFFLLEILCMSGSCVSLYVILGGNSLTFQLLHSDISSAHSNIFYC